MSTMLHDIISLLLQVITGLLAGTCLLRLYIHFCGVPLSLRSGNPIAPFVFALTNWLVLPLRRVLPPIGRFDTASFMGAYGVLLVKYALFWLMADGVWSLTHLPVQAALDLMSTCLSGLIWLVILYALLSWLRSNAEAVYFFERLVEPLLVPIRRVLPRIGGLDGSPLVLILLLQVAEIALHHISRLILV